METICKTIDANHGVADVAFRLNEVVAIYPITPASGIGEWCDQWASEERKNIWKTIPDVVELQSEGGAAGAVHGSLQTGSLTTTFTASQGLLLMVPNMYKIAGELTPAVFHIAARSIAAQALSIFGDHSDVTACRGTGWAMIPSGSVQEAMDFALIAQQATLESRVPFLHFFDGFRTSHEMGKVQMLPDELLEAMIDPALIEAHRERALSPDHPVLRGTAQNPDVFFQARESVNSYYLAIPGIVQKTMDKFAELTGRQYHLFDYVGAPDAESVIVLMGSGAETAHETVEYLTSLGEKVGVLKVRLYRPFDALAFVNALPATTKRIAVLDRTKEPGAPAEPLHLDCIAALQEVVGDEGVALETMPKVVGGRYGLSSKEFTPPMVKAVFDNLEADKPKNHFTIGINDDVTHTSLDIDEEFFIEHDNVVRAMFYGLGADGTVGAAKNSIKIIGEGTDLNVQGFFVYDSRKSGAITISHLRFGPDPIRSTYLIKKAQFVGCHQTIFLERFDVSENLAQGGTFVLNTYDDPEEAWRNLPKVVQEGLIKKNASFYVIDAYKVARESNLGNHINTVMQVCFFALSGILPLEEALSAIREAIRKTYSKRGPTVVKWNLKAVDQALDHLIKVEVPSEATGEIEIPFPVPKEAPDFIKEVEGEILAGRGNELPVSMLPVDGTYPTASSKWEKRNIALEIPAWDSDICIQCGKCSIVCPHGTIRIKVYDEALLEGAPASFKHTAARDRDWKGLAYTLQIAPEDCSGCGACVDVCPARNKWRANLKAINMVPQPPIREQERANWEFFEKLPEVDRTKINVSKIRQQQVQQPLFEFSSACAGCGETPYLKLLTQLFGDRTVVANATGCSSIYGGNLPTTPWSKNDDGYGPAWSNSLFEDNAEFGLGFRVSIDKQAEMALELLTELKSEVGDELADAILGADQTEEAEIYEQRERVAKLVEKLEAIDTDRARRLLSLSNYLVKKCVWIVGGDGWAYDIGYGGLDHVLASGRNVNILVLDTEVYSNTGGQMSKATPTAAVAKFAAGGKRTPKKDLGQMAMSYGTVYVAQVALGARDDHTLKAFIEAEAYEGPSIIIAYSHCIAHGINMTTANRNQKAAVDSGQWLLYRYHPDRAEQGKPPLQLDSRAPKMPITEFFQMENRFRMLTRSKPEVARILAGEAQQYVERRREIYEALASYTPAIQKGE